MTSCRRKVENVCVLPVEMVIDDMTAGGSLLRYANHYFGTALRLNVTATRRFVVDALELHSR